MEMERANELRNALARVDRNGDGLLNFDEFKSGLRDLGVALPEQEIAKIWHEASNGSSSIYANAKAAGRPTLQSTSLPEVQETEGPRSTKRTIKTHEQTPFHSHLSSTFVASDEAIVSGVDGVHSHKKVGFSSGNCADQIALDGGSLTTANRQKTPKRKNLEPKSNLTPGAMPRLDDTGLSPARSARGVLDFSPAEGHEPGRLSSPEICTSFNTRAMEGVWEENTTVDLNIAGHRIVQDLTDKYDLWKKEVDKMGERTVDYRSFQKVSNRAGLILGDEDARRLWVAAGGALGRHGEVAGSVELPILMERLALNIETERDFGKKSMTNTGYAPHLQSTLTKGFEVQTSEETTHNEDRIGPMRRAAVDQRPPDTPGFLELHNPVPGNNSTAVDSTACSAMPSSVIGSPGKGSPGKGESARWTKIEDKVRTGLQTASKRLYPIFGVTSTDSCGRKLIYDELKKALTDCGFPMSNNDFEVTWRRADAECLGEVGYQDLMNSFRVHMPESGTLLASRRGLVDPFGRVLDKGNDSAGDKETAAIPLPPSTLDQQRREDRVTFSQLQYNPEALKRMRRAVGDRLVGEEEFQHIIKDAGMILSDTDTSKLFRRVCSADGRACLTNIEAVLTPLDEVVAPAQTESVLGFGTGSRLQKVSGRSAKFKGHFGQDDPLLRNIYEKVASSGMGNPQRLRQLFRKYDIDRNGSVSKDEFMSALLGHNIPVSRDECLFLADVADTEDRSVVKYEDFIRVVTAVGTQEVAEKRQVRSHRRGDSELRERSTDSVSSVRSRGSLRSERSNASIRSQRSTSSFAGRLQSYISDAQKHSDRPQTPNASVTTVFLHMYACQRECPSARAQVS